MNRSFLDHFRHDISFDRLIAARPVVRPGRPGPDRRAWIIRPEDLLVLEFELVNLRVEKSDDGEPAQLVKQGRGQAYLVVRFPPQHLTEKAYFTTVEDIPVSTPEGAPTDPDQSSGDEDPEEPPIQAILSGWSRLVFRVPDARLPIPWTLTDLLQAMGELELSVPANALPPKVLQVRWDKMLTSALDKASLIETGLLERIATSAGTLSIGRAASDTAPVERLLPVSRPGFRSPGGQLIEVARARRTLRLLGSQVWATGLTGSATRNLHETLVGELVAQPIAPVLVRPEPRPPGDTQTAIELPYHIILSPNRYGAWFHAQDPVTSEETGHTELWHTRLGVRRPDGTLIDGDDWRRTLRAVWTPDSPPPLATPAPGDAVDLPDHVNFPWRMSLDSFDRHNVVHLSSNFKLREPDDPATFYEPNPLAVDLLALTSLGAWLDSRGTWDLPQPAGLSVEEWRHRATLGRDHYVRVVYAGFLFPWGHRASLIKITERQFHDDLPGDPAYLRQRMFLVVREPFKTYRNSGLAYQGSDTSRKGEQFDLMMPFESVRITTLVSPLLDRPEDDHIAEKGQGCFWPRVGGQPFKFHLVATDTAGHQVDLAMPLIFVGKEETDKKHSESVIPDDVVQAYAARPWPGTSILRATVPVGGQRMALAESAAPDDTVFAVQALTFGAEVPIETTYDGLSRLKPRFFPVVRSAEIDIPSLQSIARTSQPAGVVFAGVYLQEGFNANNAGEVFLAKDAAAPDFGVLFSSQGDRSGGLITPDLSLSGLSRVTGPISGDLTTAAAGSFDPDQWFGALAGAKLFGVLALTDILDAFGFDELDKLPQFVGQSLNQVEQLIANIERLRTLLATDPVPETATITALLDQLLDPDTGSIPALLKGGNVATVVAQLGNLHTELGTLQGTLAGSSLPPGPKALVREAIGTLQDGIDAILAAAGLLQSFADGDLLPESLEARFEWRPHIKAWGPFKPSGPRNLVLAVQAAGDKFVVTCSLDDFVLDLYVLVLDFERVQLRMRSGGKPEVDVKFTDFEFAGPLSFVETLRDIIPFDGFSDPPDVQVTAEGITAGFTMGLPGLAVGVFSLENLSLGAGFSVPFLGPPLSVWFNFCERENPARLTVSMFGGGFFFGITLNADGLYLLEGAIEFGAAISVNFGVASGGVSAMAGLYFKIEASDTTLAGYFRLRGEVNALGFISVSIELYLEMRYESASGKCVGTATLTIEIDVTLFSVSISLTCTKKFAGSGGDPTFAELMDVAPDATSADWDTYCLAFA
jgi:hypothetical protein